jgi:hypothetical protein
MDTYDVAIVGGGPAGSATALFLRRLGCTVCLLERKQFPREILCGEFLSHEVTESLTDLGIDARFMALRPNAIDTLIIHSERGRSAGAKLGFTGYGMKRGTFDQFLLAEAREHGVTVIQPAEVSGIARTGSSFTVRFTDGSGVRELSAAHVVCAYGKQNILDKKLNRAATGAPSHLNGVKFHIDRELCPGIDTGAIHLFTGSHLYCGVNAVDENKVTVCFLEQRTAGDESPRRQLARLWTENQSFRNLFADGFSEYAEHVQLYGTGNIHFGGKEAVVDGIFMVGDAAGVIAPLTGDGIGMAFEGARLVAEIFALEREGSLAPDAAAHLYTKRRNTLFKNRLRIARSLQTVLLSSPLRTFGLSAINAVPRMLPIFVSLTRG